MVASGSSLALPGLTNSINQTVFQASDAGSTISLANLISLDGSSSSASFNAYNGGQIGLGSLTASTAVNLWITAYGAGSIDLSNLTSLTGAGTT